jgi:hypothetical protein
MIGVQRTTRTISVPLRYTSETVGTTPPFLLYIKQLG